MLKTRSGFLKIFLLLFMLVAIHHCLADDAEEEVEDADGADEMAEDDELDIMPPDEEVEDDSTEDGAELEAYEGEEESEEPLDSHGLTAEEMQAIHKKIDTNTDGKITMEEVKKFVHNMELDDALKYTAEQVKQMPAATSGKYTSNEILHFHGGYPDLPGVDGEKDEAQQMLLDEQERHHVMFKAADENSDGVLDEKELTVYYFPEHYDHALTAKASYELKKLDTNNDFQLSEVELARFGDGLEDIENEFKQHDKDGNGFLSLEELKPYFSDYHTTDSELNDLFDTADADGDKHISAAELQEAHPALEGPAFLFLGAWAPHPEL